MGEDTRTTFRLQKTTGLRAKLVRAMVLTLVIVTGATVVTVGYMNYRSARATLDTIETHIRQSIARKGHGLAANHALALRGLVADNAFGDVARVIERSVRDDDEDRKSTRLNSSHSQISYAVFCLKKKKKKTETPTNR